MSRSFGILLFVLLALPVLGQAQEGKAAIDHSQEAFVIENFSSKQKFENDGTSSKEDTARIHIQSEAGVQAYGLLGFSYASATGSFEIPYVRVRKPDGSVIETPPENVQDMTAQITREAPFYSDLHEKHVTVKGLNVGDVLEFQTLEHTAKPLAPGQFWASYDFTDAQIVLDEQLEISVPQNRIVKVKSSSVQPVVTEAGGYRIYTWHHANLQRKDEKNEKREATERTWQIARGRLPQPDVMLSSFVSWGDVGRWYYSLQEEGVKPTPEIVAKAAELTANAASDEAKIRALYAYVSTQFHYIGVAFGIGRYQPHSAGVVLENQYGDCKDKHTLLASLLAAVGVHAYPALISNHYEIDADVPSPGQFDHVITVVLRPDGMTFLDTTSEVGPFGYLVAPLRDKHALAVWKDSPAALVSTPADPPESVQTFNMDAKLSDAGTLEGNTDFTVRGDLEYLFRAGFRSLPVTQWKDLSQRISLGFGFGGEVSSVTASSPEKTDEPFHLSYKYTRKEFGDWANRRILAPEPLIALPALGDEDSLPLGPLWLGSLMDVRLHSQVELPRGTQPMLPPNVHVKRDFAQFDATYQYKDGKMIAERRLKVLLHEVPPNEREQFKQLVKAMQDDYGVFIPLLRGLAESAPTSSEPAWVGALRKLPNSPNDEATRLEGESRQARLQDGLESAISLLYRAVAVDENFTRAWVQLGSVLLALKRVDAGIEAFRKAMANDPEEAAIPKAFGDNLMGGHYFEQAVPVWQDYVKAHPDDPDGPLNLGICLVRLKRYSEAIAALEGATTSGGDQAELQVNLANAYLLAGEREKAGTAFAKLAEVDPQGKTFNDAAYTMANADLQLPFALEYAKKATREIEEGTQKITFSDLTTEDLGKNFGLAAYWDTLGWVHERMSNFNAAELYLRASWKLTQSPVTAGHLCHLYRRIHETAKAIQMCRLALFRFSSAGQVSAADPYTEIDAVRENLKFLTGSVTSAKSTGDASDIVIRERRFDLPRFLPGTESAEFFVLLESDGKSRTFKVSDVRFISGSDKMKNEGKRLRNIDFKVPAPDDVPARFVRRGILGCYQYTGCSFVLLDPAIVHSVD